MLTKEKLEAEIKANKESIEKLEKIHKDCEYGVEINKIVLAALERELLKINRNFKE